MTNEVSFAHLSDIHFKYFQGSDVWDVNKDLRVELERDLGRIVEDSGPLTGLLVTGDIAFSGANDEYQQAAEWLDGVCEIVRCQSDDVWTVPGNHDVARSVIHESNTIQDFHRRMRKCDVPDIDGLLYDYLVSDKSGGDAHLAPLANYTAFATRYSCAMTAQRPFWDSEIPIGTSAVRLRIRGMTSALISDDFDDSDGNRLVMGTVQADLHREAGSILMTLSHHPLSWLRDGERVGEILAPKAQIQLWGHRHTQMTRVLDGNVHLFAGAVHPARAEVEWEPRYNILRLSVDDHSSEATLTIDARTWKRQDSRFAADYDVDGNRLRIYPLPFEPMAPKEGVDGTEGLDVEGPPVEQRPRDARRRLAYLFSSLPYQKRLAIARKLELLDPDTRGILDQELFEAVLSLAVRRNQLALLWTEVQAESGNPDATNPFAEGDAG